MVRVEDPKVVARITGDEDRLLITGSALRARPGRGAGSGPALTLRKTGCLRRTRRAVIGDPAAEVEGGVMRREREAVTARL